VASTATLPLALVATAVLALALTARLRSVLPLDPATTHVDGYVEIGVVGIGIALSLWLAWGFAVATACSAARAAGHTWRAGEHAVARYAPALVRRVLVVAIGAGMSVSVVAGANAATPVDELDVGWAVTEPAATAPTAEALREATEAAPSTTPAAAPAADDVAPSTGVPTPAPDLSPAPVSPAGPATPATTSPVDPAPLAALVGEAPATVTTTASAVTGPATGRPTTGATAATPVPVESPADAGTVLVGPGDSLWRIAARALPPGATDAEIAAEWPRWYAANVAVVGPDPGVLHPGQVLRAPGPTTSTTSEGSR
jgi:LysM repeat protein